MQPIIIGGIDVACCVFYAFVLFFIVPRLLSAPRGPARGLSARGRTDRRGRDDCRRPDAHRRPRSSCCRSATARSPRRPGPRAVSTSPHAAPTRFAGAPYAPTGNPLARRHRPGRLGRPRQAARSRHGRPSAHRAAAQRAGLHGRERAIPIRAACRSSAPTTSIAGTVSDLWIDRAELSSAISRSTLTAPAAGAACR